MLGVLVSALTFAGRKADAPKSAAGIAVVKRDANAYKLIYKSEQRADVKVEIYDSKDKLVFSEVIRDAEGFVRPYNLETLSKGEYTIKVDNGSNWLSETITVGANSIEDVAQLIRTQDGRYLLTVAGHGHDFLSVKIWDGEGKSVHQEISSVSGDFARVYNMEKVQGPFSFEVSDTSGRSKIFKK